MTYWSNMRSSEFAHWLIFKEALLFGVTRWRSCLRHWATSWKVAGSIADGVIGIFYWHEPSGRTMTLVSSEPLTEMSTRNISWGVKAAGGYDWQPYHLYVLNVLTYLSLNLLETSESVQTCNGIALPFYYSSETSSTSVFRKMKTPNVVYYLQRDILLY